MADVTVDVVNKKETAMSTATADANGEARAVPSRSRIEHPSKRERAARGKTARAEVPRSAHADWEPPAGRRDPVAALLEEEQTRLPELVPLRHGRMAASPFTFYRGAAGLMAADLAGAPRTGLQVQLCGDAHLSNFGAFAAPDRRLIFGLNDFDETLPGPFEWDVKRFVASIAIAGRDRGFTAKQREPINLAAGRSYREAMRAFAAMRVLDVWYARLDVEQIAKRWSSEVSGKQLKRFDRNVAKARAKDSQRAADKLTHVVAGDVRIVSAPPLIVPIEELAEDQAAIEDLIRTVVRSYRRTLASDRRHLPERFHYAHAARKVVGVSRRPGRRCWNRISATASSPTADSASSRASG